MKWVNALTIYIQNQYEKTLTLIRTIYPLPILIQNHFKFNRSRLHAPILPTDCMSKANTNPEFVLHNDITQIINHKSNIKSKRNHTSGAIQRYVPVSAVITPDWVCTLATPKSATLTNCWRRICYLRKHEMIMLEMLCVF